MTPEERSAVALALVERIEWLAAHPEARARHFAEEFRKDHGAGARQDQLDAARNELMGVMPFRDTAGRAQEWMRLSLYRALIGWANAEGETCRHNPTPDAPRPIFGAAARPGLVVCERCRDMLGVADVITPKAPCDRCGAVEGEGAITCWLSWQSFAYAFALCSRCNVPAERYLAGKPRGKRNKR